MHTPPMCVRAQRERAPWPTVWGNEMPFAVSFKTAKCVRASARGALLVDEKTDTTPKTWFHPHGPGLLRRVRAVRHLWTARESMVTYVIYSHCVRSPRERRAVFRREGDSNPWYDHSYASLAMKYFRPLSHLSTYTLARCVYTHKTWPNARTARGICVPRPVGLEPTTSGFGDLRSTNWTKDACICAWESYHAKRSGISETVRSDRIRTCDHIVPNDVRYQTALHSDVFYWVE